MPLSIVIAYSSGYGHTERVARAVAEGASALAEVALVNVAQLDDAAWAAMDAADGIVFGAPTYMGGVSAQFKAFIDGGSKRWFAQAWRNKIAAGFTNSGAQDGDRLSALMQLSLFAMQHGMIWVGTGIMAAGEGEGAINRFGSFLGAMTQSTNAPPELTPPAGDIETARLFGARVAELAAQFVRGKQLSEAN